MGFWVAMTKKGEGSSCTSPRKVMRFSSMASRNADWVFGVARLISSPSTMLAKMGPL